MTVSEILKEQLEFVESYQMPDKLLGALLDDDRRELLFEAFSDFDLTKDFLNYYFQDEQSERKGLKQDYTPECLCDLIRQLSGEPVEVFDLCSGTGSLSIPFWIKNKQTRFVCVEFSERAIPMLLFNLAIRKMDATVYRADALKNEVFECYDITDGKVTLTDNIEYPQGRFQLAVSNPPYSMKWDGNLNLYDGDFFGYETPPNSKADYAFIFDGLAHSNGKSVFILPHGVLFRGNAEGKIRERLVLEKRLSAVIGLPDKMFRNTSIPVCVMIFENNSEDVLFIEASKHFKTEGKFNYLTAENIDKIVDTYRNRKTVDKFSHLASLKEIEENEFNLNIPRYVDTSVREPLPDINALLDETFMLEKEIVQTHVEFLQLATELEETTGNTRQYRQAKAKLKLWENLVNELSKMG